MKHAFFLAILLPWVTLTPGAAAAGQGPRPNASACYNIADPDARAFCLAKAHAERGRCYNIQSAAVRSMCLAETSR